MKEKEMLNSFSPERLLALVLVAAGLVDGGDEMTQDDAKRAIADLRESALSVIPVLFGNDASTLADDFTRFAARNMGVYHYELIASGFTRQEAFELTRLRAGAIRDGFESLEKRLNSVRS